MYWQALDLLWKGEEEVRGGQGRGQVRGLLAPELYGKKREGKDSTSFNLKYAFSVPLQIMV